MYIIKHTKYLATILTHGWNNLVKHTYVYLFDASSNPVDISYKPDFLPF